MLREEQAIKKEKAIKFKSYEMCNTKNGQGLQWCVHFPIHSLRFAIIVEGKEYICDNAQEH